MARAPTTAGWIATETATGTGGGPPLVLIHGLGTNRSIWSASGPALAERRPVTTLDLPGFGASPAPPRWSLEAVATLVIETLATDIGEPFDLVGSSLGGAVALAAAHDRPDLVRRLILVSPAGFRPAPGALSELLALAAGPLLGARRIAGLRTADSRTARRALLAGAVADGGALEPERARLILRASAGAASLRPAFRAAMSADLRPAAAVLAPPLGLVWGALDRVVPASTAERILELHPDAPLELIEGAGHIPHLETPDRFVAAVERLLSRLA